MLQYMVESKLKKSGYGWFTVVNILYGGGGGVGGNWHIVELQKIDLFSYSRNGFELS